MWLLPSFGIIKKPTVLSYKTSAFKISNKFSHWFWSKFSAPNFPLVIYYKFIIGSIAFWLQSSFIIRVFPLKLPTITCITRILYQAIKRLRPNTEVESVSLWNHDTFCQCLILQSSYIIRMFPLKLSTMKCITRIL